MIKSKPLSSISKIKCSTGCHLLDSFLAGGLPCSSLTEIVGESAACKTQLCLQLLLTATKSQAQGGLGGRAIYLYTEGEPPVGRLQDLYCRQQHRQLTSLLDRILIKSSIYSAEDLEKQLNAVVMMLERQKQQADDTHVRLVVIDSIAEIYRDPGNGDRVSYSKRSTLMFKVAAQLKRMADRFDIAIVTTNQVTDLMRDPGDTKPKSQMVHTAGLHLISSNREVVPSLGLAWANCVNTRIFLSKGPVAEGQQSSGLRCMQIVFSPALPQSYCYFHVTAQGVFGLSGPEAWTQPICTAAPSRQDIANDMPG